MPELLKGRYNQESIHALAIAIKTVHEDFQVENFMDAVMDETWENRELKARMRKITICLGEYLPHDYEVALQILDQVIDKLSNRLNGFMLMCFPDFVEVYGQDDNYWDLSVAALARYTPYSTSEFAVRPFIIKEEERMMKQMLLWSQDENEHVRRLASEGCRPQLPWGQALTSFKQNPLPILPILEALKADDSLYVRKSVANNLNDISKTHPELVISLAKEWFGVNPLTDWIIKHACRTLLKKGNPEVLAIFGYHVLDSVKIEQFALDVSTVALGDALSLTFAISVDKPAKVRMEYRVDYMKANGKRSGKIFQISETELKQGVEKIYQKKLTFKNLTTRKHYAGKHSVTLIVNGIEQGTLDFELTIPQ